MNNNGLINGLIAILVIIFMLAISILITTYGWNLTNSIIQNQTNDTIDQSAKDKINDLGEHLEIGPKIFLITFVILIFVYLATSITLPTQYNYFFVVFIIFLICFSIVAMFLTNGWNYLTDMSFFSSQTENLKTVDYIMRYQPYILFMTGLIGGLLFYGRRYVAGENKVDDFE